MLEITQLCEYTMLQTIELYILINVVCELSRNKVIKIAIESPALQINHSFLTFNSPFDFIDALFYPISYALSSLETPPLCPLEHKVSHPQNLYPHPFLSTFSSSSCSN